MIKSKKDYREYLIEDMKATNIYHLSIIKKIFDRRYKYYHSLRKTEYYCNCKKTYLGKVIFKYLNFRHKLLCDKYCWTIPINVFGKGLSIVHSGTIVVSGYAKIGDYCRIHVDTNIGNAPSHGLDGAPTIGDNVYIGPGAKIFGPIVIGDNVAIGANAVVNKSFEEGNCTIAGIPAKIISENNSSLYINKGDE